MLSDLSIGGSWILDLSSIANPLLRLNVSGRLSRLGCERSYREGARSIIAQQSLTKNRTFGVIANLGTVVSLVAPTKVEIQSRSERGIPGYGARCITENQDSTEIRIIVHQP
jgi:hypothetical protein